MKRFLTLLILVMSSVIVKADDGNMVKAYLFPQFEKGTVALKSNGARLSAQLNYNMVAKRMMFLESDSALIELDTRNVVMITIGERSFIPVQNKGCYEVIKSGNNEYYISHNSVIMSKGKASGYGSYSQTSAINSISSVQSSGYMTKIGFDEKFEGVDQSYVLIKNEKKYEKIVSLKNLVKCFKSHQAAIETFAKDNNIKFNKLENVMVIVEYAFSL